MESSELGNSITEDGYETRNAWGDVPLEMHNHTLDSSRWQRYRFRHDDVVIATWAKAGTTWIQQIVGQLIFDAPEMLPVFDLAPWIEHRCFSESEMHVRLEAQAHRRFVKTHLPAEALIFSPNARYVYVARDGRDVVWSWYNHHGRLPRRVLDFINDVPGRIGPALAPAGPDVRRFFLEWLERDGFPLWPFWSHVRSWWSLRERENVLLVHFNALKNDTRSEIARIARFLHLSVEEESWPRILERCSFAYMKQHASTLSPILDRTLDGGAREFVYRGTNGRWRDVLSEDEVEKYEAIAQTELGIECARWLATGETRARGDIALLGADG